MHLLSQLYNWKVCSRDGAESVVAAALALVTRSKARNGLSNVYKYAILAREQPMFRIVTLLYMKVYIQLRWLQINLANSSHDSTSHEFSFGAVGRCM
jgi:hypothetical protein